MIRVATPDDKTDIVRLMRDFSRMVLDEDISPHEYTDVLDTLISDHVVLVSDEDGVEGVIIGQVVEHPFWRKRMLQEVAWFARDNSGIALLREFTKAAKEIDAEVVYLTVLESAGPRVHALMQRLGFDVVERSYIMKLK